jgi:hypothetical protein
LPVDGAATGFRCESERIGRNPPGLTSKAASNQLDEEGGKQHISRVLFTASGPGGLAAGVTICLGPPLPAASSGTGKTEREDGQPLFRGPKPWPCSWPGFTEPAPLDAAGALLPHPCTLACAAGGPRPAGRHRRCVSVALSSRSPAPGVTRQAWPSGSPDFPQPAEAHPGPEARPRSTDRDHLGCFPGIKLLKRCPLLAAALRAGDPRELKG